MQDQNAAVLYAWDSLIRSWRHTLQIQNVRVLRLSKMSRKDLEEKAYIVETYGLAMPWEVAKGA